MCLAPRQALQESREANGSMNRRDLHMCVQQIWPTRPDVMKRAGSYPATRYMVDVMCCRSMAVPQSLTTNTSARPARRAAPIHCCEARLLQLIGAAPQLMPLHAVATAGTACTAAVQHSGHLQAAAVGAWCAVQQLPRAKLAVCGSACCTAALLWLQRACQQQDAAAQYTSTRSCRHDSDAARCNICNKTTRATHNPTAHSPNDILVHVLSTMCCLHPGPHFGNISEEICLQV